MEKLALLKNPTSRGWRKTHFKNVGIGHIRGYAGLVNTAKKISEYIPPCKTFVEPFAGLGRISKVVNAEHKILNDKSDYAFNYLKKNFPNDKISQKDFIDFTLENIYGDVFFFDPPWSMTEYKDGCLGRAFCDRTVKEYYDDILKMVKELLNNKICFIAGNKNNIYLKNSGLHLQLIQSRQKIMGGRISTLLASNKPFNRYNQSILF